MRRPPPAAPEPAAPLTPGELAALLDALGPFEPAPHIAVAVSGGPDSMALALLAAVWAQAREGQVLALIVDHGLRPGSAADAAQAWAWLGELGISARVLTWAGPKPGTGIQAAARAARMALLQQACRAEAILHLLLAHHRDDQAETVVMRREAGSGPGGLAGIPAVREVPGLRLLRPLLAVPKARLAATLAAAGRPWLIDPANAAQRFARGRLRADPSFRGEAAWEESAARAVARRAEDERVAAALARLARPHALGFLRLDAEAWGGLDRALRAAVLGRLLASVGGRAYPIAAAAIARAAGEAFKAAATLGGCIIVRRGDDLVTCREPGRIRDRLVLAPGGSGCWDGRFELRHAAGSQEVEIAALGARGAALLDRSLRERLRQAGVPALVLHGLPTAWVGGRLVACPPLEAHGLRGEEGFSITALLRPALPLAAAPFAGVNVVSNPQQPIYRRATARVCSADAASAVSPAHSPRSTSRRTQ